MNGDLVVVSPHLDDAVLAASSLLLAHPGARVLTVCTATPADGAASDWDRICGFTTAGEAMQARRAEDGRALRRLGAVGVHLGFLDSGYAGSPPPPGQVAAAIAAHVGPGAQLAAPLGLGHPDHVAVAEAAALAARRAGLASWLLYADFYQLAHPELVGPRLRALADTGLVVREEPAPPVGSRWARQQAVRRYRSQRRGLGHRVHRWAVAAGVRLWRVELAAQ